MDTVTARYTATAVLTSHGTERRVDLGSAPSLRKARRIGYREGKYEYPRLSHSTLFDLEIVDTRTGEKVPARWAEMEAYNRRNEIVTVGERGIW